MPTGTRRNVLNDGPMDDEHRNILKRCREALVKDMEPGKVLLQMTDPLLFTTDDQSAIKAERTRVERCEVLLDKVERKGAKAYETFKETIEIVHPHLTSIILKAETLELRSELRTERTNSVELRTRLNTAGSQTCSRCSDLEKELDKLKKDNQEYEKDNKRLREENKKNEATRKQTNKDLNGRIRALMQEKRDLEKEKEDVELRVEEITGKYDKVKAESDHLVEKTGNDSTEIERLNKEANELRSLNETLQQEIIKSKSFVSTVFTPKGKDFQSAGVICTLTRDASANVVATRSSEGPGKASDVFIRRRGKTSGTAEIQDSWWCVDIGENHLLFPTHYSLRHGKEEGDSILRGWELQGSIDGKDWKNIKTCQRKYDLNGQPKFAEPIPYVTGTWPVEGKGGAFRGKYGIYLSRIEFYGVLLKV